MTIGRVSSIASQQEVTFQSRRRPTGQAASGLVSCRSADLPLTTLKAEVPRSTGIEWRPLGDATPIRLCGSNTPVLAISTREEVV